MAKDEENTDQPDDPNSRCTVSEQDKLKARKWFKRADELVEQRNYDFGLKCYIEGLTVWPEAVDEGHQKLRGCGVARQHGGGKKAGFGETMKHSMTAKDPIKAMLNAEWLLAHDPMNISFMEGAFKNANKAHCDDTAMWIGQALKSAAEQEKKPSAKRFAMMKTVYEELGDRAEARGDSDLAVEAFTRAVDMLNIQARLDPKDSSIPNVRRDLSTKLTILKGKYQTGESFTDSIKDKKEQEDIRDTERMVQSDDRLGELIAKAKVDIEANPGITGKVMNLIDLLTRNDDSELESQAIGVLVERYTETDDYRFKLKADDIRMKQLSRSVRETRAKGDAAEIKKARISQLRYELTVFKERTDKYPTEKRFRYEYANRLFKARKFDDAIPLFQEARSDPKFRARSDVYLGRCFFEKDYYDQVVATLTRSLGAQDVQDTDDAKSMRYWLGRAVEALGQTKEALECYGQLLELDYNYKDVRVRLDALRKHE